MEKWKILSLLLMVVLFVTDIVYRILYSYKYSGLDVLFYGLVGGTICLMTFLVLMRKSIRIPGTMEEGAMLMTIGVLIFVGFWLLREAQSSSHNLALVNAFAYSSVIATFLAMHFYFGDKVGAKALVGVVLVVIGVILIALNDA